jgi:hypothetical protein
MIPPDNGPLFLKKPLVFWSLALVAVGLRVCGMLWPANFDQESWSLVSDLVLDGKNVYASTNRYNYGPVWMGIIAGLKALAGDEYFRLAVCLFLSAIDIATAALLRARGYALAAVIFLFSPWTIFISGHHHMFDNVAVLIGLLAVNWVESRPSMKGGEQRMSNLSIRDTIIGAAIIGCSLMVKHILWIFPVWMAFRTRSFPRRVLWLCLPVGMFIASFIPFWHVGKGGIMQNVLHYAASSNAPMFYMLAPNIIDLFLGYGPHPKLARLIFGGTLILAGAVLRRRTLFEWYVTYLLFVVLLSSAIWNQFLVIPVIFTVLYRNVWGLLYHLLAIPFYIIEDSGFNLGETLSPAWDGIEAFSELYGHYVFLSLLLAAYLREFWVPEIRRGWQALRARVAGSVHGHE